MQSKTSFFNATLFYKNLTRYWPLWGLASFFGAQVALALWTAVIGGGIDRSSMDALNLTEIYYNVVCYGLPILSMVYAVLCAAAVWNYLYTARSVGFMHALPIRREGIFLTNFLSGMVMMLIPYAVTGGITILFSLFFRAFDPLGVLVTILAVAGESFFFFSMATLTAFVTGSAAAMPLLYGIFNFLEAAVDGLVSLLARGFVFGLSDSYSGKAEFLSPVVYLMRHVEVKGEYEQVPLAGFDGYYSKLTAVSLGRGWLIAVYALVGVVFTLAAFALYRRRRSESAGDVVAVGWMKPIFLWGLAVCSALSGGQALYAMFFQELFRDGGLYRAVPMAACLLVAGAIGYLAAKMLLAKSLKVFDRRTAAGIGALAALSLALCFALKADLFGAERRIPAAEELKSAAVSIAGDTYQLTPDRDGECLARVLTLHRELVDHKDDVLARQDPYGYRSSYDPVSREENRWAHQWVRFTYTLKNGRELHREYTFYLDREQMGVGGTLEAAMDTAVNSAAMQLKRLHADGDGYTAESGSLYLETVDFGYDFSSRELQALYDALRQDAAAGAWGRQDWFDERMEERYALNLDISFTLEDREWDHLNVDVYPEMTNTLRFLRSLDFVGEDNLLTYAEWERRMNAGESDFWGGKRPPEWFWEQKEKELYY